MAVLALALLTQAFSVELPTSGLFFYETFDDSKAFTSGRWVKSSNDKYSEQHIEIAGIKDPNENLTASYQVKF